MMFHNLFCLENYSFFIKFRLRDNFKHWEKVLLHLFYAVKNVTLVTWCPNCLSFLHKIGCFWHIRQLNDKKIITSFYHFL